MGDENKIIRTTNEMFEEWKIRRIDACEVKEKGKKKKNKIGRGA